MSFPSLPSSLLSSLSSPSVLPLPLCLLYFIFLPYFFLFPSPPLHMSAPLLWPAAFFGVAWMFKDRDY